MTRTCKFCGHEEHNDGYIICLDCGRELPNPDNYSSEDADDGTPGLPDSVSNPCK